jgi:DNA modification methylase
MSEIEWHIEKRKVSDLKAYHKNPRRLTKDQAAHLKTSLDKFGLIDKPCINLDNTVIGGHQRLNVWGRDEIEVNVPNRMLEDKEVEECNIRLNRNTGEWDFDVLANEWETADLIDWGFTLDELSIAPIEELCGSEEEDEPCEFPKNPVTILGDIYELNEHIVICNDCTNLDIVLPFLEKNSPNIMITDPPYGVIYDPNKRVEKRKEIRGGKTPKNRQAKILNDERCDWSIVYSSFPGNVLYVWHSGLFSDIFFKNIKDSGYKICNQIVWVKNNFAIAWGDYHYQHEPCIYAVRNGQSTNWQGSRKESTAWFIPMKDTDEESTIHSTQKPLECMAIPIRNNTSSGEWVYDPFLGSGTTLLCCEKLHRKCLGVELYPLFVDVIVDRWVRAKQKKSEKFVVKRNGTIVNWEELKEKALNL